MRYRTLVADPPWEYPEGFAGTEATGHDRRKGGVETVRRELPYPSLPLDDICELRVSDLSDPDSRLFLWTTSRWLEDAFTVVRAWGFKYRQTLVWHKPDAFFGGSVAPNAEFLIVATRGAPPRLGRMPNAVVTYASGN